MTPATALVLLGFGVGALMIADRTSPRVPQSLRATADALREQTVLAQAVSARASHRARELIAQWSNAEGAAQKAGQ